MSESGHGFRVRDAVRKDCPAILAIYNDAVLKTTASYDYEPRSLESRQMWFEDHERRGLPVLVAESRPGEIIGWASLSLFHDRPGYRYTVENSIYVAEVSRGRGVGSALLRLLLERASRGGFRAVIACIDASNDTSVRLHAKQGFEEVGRFRSVGYKFNRWLDVVYMEKLLAIPAGVPGGTP